MNNIIDQLSDIEHNAVAIMDAATTRKKEIAAEMADKTLAFDTQLETDTAGKIQEMKHAMEIDMQAKLSKQKADANEALTQMEANYHENHERYAKELFDAMIGR